MHPAAAGDRGDPGAGYGVAHARAAQRDRLQRLWRAVQHAAREPDLHRRDDLSAGRSAGAGAMMPLVLDPADGLERQNEKLRQITGVLMSRIERDLADERHGYAQFQLAAALEEQVRARTRDLDEALQMLSIANARLTGARREAEQARNDLYAALEAVQQGFALFDPEDRLILSNSRFSAQLPDVAARLGSGLSFGDYVRLVAESPHMELHDCPTRAEWTRQRLARHRHQHVDFIVRLTGDRWLQVSEYRSPTGGT